ncbi:MAG TPA: ankyrin repeat domain-containing protein [Candidatus Babeliales bacterium]|nr:ankyrin repeat domain-containing protein [Candidatus Babeliales bacterium]
MKKFIALFSVFIFVSSISAMGGDEGSMSALGLENRFGEYQKTKTKPELLIWASQNGLTRGVKQLIHEGVDLNTPDTQYNNTPLIWASLQGYIDIANVLVEAKADLDAQNDLGETALISAVKRGHLDIVNVLIKAKADLNAQNDLGETALIKARKMSKGDIAEVLTEAGANVGVQDVEGYTASSWCDALSDSSTEDSSSESDEVSETGVVDNVGWTPLMRAARDGDIEEVQRLLDISKIYIDYQDDTGLTALMLAASAGHKDVVQALLDAGADFDLESIGRSKALSLALGYGHKEAAQLLMGAKIKANKEKTSAEIETLLSKGGDVNFLGSRGFTALMKAAIMGNVDLVQRLLAASANPNIQTSDGRTALSFAKEHEQPEVENILNPLTDGYWLRKLNENRAAATAATLLAAAGSAYAWRRWMRR